MLMNFLATCKRLLQGVHVSKRHIAIVGVIALLCVAAVSAGLVLGIPAVQQQLRARGGRTRLFPANPTSLPPPSATPLGKFRAAAVTADGTPCAAIGRSILGKGGNAVDAGVAMLFCGSVAVPQSMGLGGGFLMTLYSRETRTALTLNARESAPARATVDMFHGNSTLSRDGPLAIAVPGEVRGYWAAHQRFGRMNWSVLIQPSIHLCREGINVTWHLAKALKEKENMIKDDPALSDIFVNPETQEVWLEGDRVKQLKLAETLQTLAEKGGDELYTGELGKKLVMDIQDQGGIITEEDLANYEAKWEQPVTVSLRNNITMYSVPPPGSGALLGYILNILDGYKLSPKSMSTDEDAILTYHRIVEAFKFAYGRRTELGDPVDPLLGDRIKELVSNLTSETFAEETRLKISDHSTSNDLLFYGTVVYQPEDDGTAHFSVLSPDGDAVSVTSTVNMYFGAKVLSSQTGVVLNNEMDDFSAPNIVNYFGIPPSPANFIRPGKRPLSSMCPAVFVDKNGDVKLIAGAAGGTRITSAVAYVALRNMWLDEDIKTAIDFRRIHNQLFPMITKYEYGFLDQYVKGLEAFGHKTERQKLGGSAARAIAREEDGLIYANSDVRKPGSIDGY